MARNQKAEPYSLAAPPARPRWKGGTLLLLAALVLVGVAVVRRLGPSLRQGAGELAVHAGSVSVGGGDGDSRPFVEAGGVARVTPGDEIQTGVSARAEVALGGGDLVMLGPSTKLTVLEMARRGTSQALHVGLALVEGDLTARVRGALVGGTDLHLDTPVVTIVSEAGTLRCVVVDRDTVTVAVYEGSAVVSMGPQEVTVSAGQLLEARLGGELVPVDAALPTLEWSGGDVQVAVEAAATATLTEPQQTRYAIATPTRPGDGQDTYVVQRGDTLYSIARAHGLDWETLWEANKDQLASPSLIKAGQTLRIPSP
ncbi:MAG: LysM peptidoglycan-binding domain-containing protein [Anaerolineae bacterium]